MLSLKNTFTKAIFVFVTIYNFAYASDPKFYLGLDASRQDLDLDKNNDIYSGIDTKDYYKNNSINPSIFAGVDVLDFLKDSNQPHFQEFYSAWVKANGGSFYF